MTVAEILGWAKSLLDTFGLTNFIVAGLVIVSALAILRKFFQD